MSIPGPVYDDKPGTGGVNAVMEAYGWKVQRTVDPVRQAALANAVELCAAYNTRNEDVLNADAVIFVARTFEAYLTRQPDGGGTDG
jgi:hypothetical protein